MKPAKPLLVPIPVSFGKNLNVDYRGTKAFSSKMDVETKKVFRNVSPEQRLFVLKRIGENAKFFMKKVTPRSREIRNYLEKNGIRVEKEVAILEKGFSIFKRAGITLGSYEGIKFVKRNPELLDKIASEIAKMHSLGVSHNHLHHGNIILTPKGEVIFIDFGKAIKADLNVKGKKQKEALRKKFNQELNVAATFLSLTYWNAKEFGVINKFVKRRTPQEKFVQSKAQYFKVQIASNYSEPLKKIMFA
ncbi:MAG: lipopolysaccharide kinase InaA family protein [Candidatus Diapherotrites archaeon]